MLALRYSVVVPAHNESENLTVLLPRLMNALQTLNGTYEVIIVDNASTDSTGRVINERMATMSQLRLVKEPTLGYGRAVLAGLHAARGEYLGIIRADNQEKSEDLVRMFAALERDGVALYKAVRKNRINDGLKRIIISRVYNLLFKLLFGLRSRDLNATPKVFTREFMETSRLRSKDWFIDAEMVIKAERTGLPVGEMEIEYLPRLHGKSTVRLRHIFEFLRNMLWWHQRVRHGKLLEE